MEMAVGSGINKVLHNILEYEDEDEDEDEDENEDGYRHGRAHKRRPPLALIVVLGGLVLCISFGNLRRRFLGRVIAGVGTGRVGVATEMAVPADTAIPIASPVRNVI